MKILIKNAFLFISLLSCLSSCLSKETPVPLKPKGAETTATIEMAEDYRWQVYYSLKNNTVVGKNLYTSWDLGFETGADAYRVILNSAKFRMVAYRTSKTDFAAVTIKDTMGIASEIDAPSGSLDSTAIADWRSGNVYILHRGTDEHGTELGMRKIQFVSVSADKYIVRFSELNGSNERTVDIPKDTRYNFSFLSFDDGGKTVQVEPPKQEWDIVFTKYTHYYYDLKLRYSVVGCVLNHFETSAGMDTVTKTFAEINLQSAAAVKLSSFITSIGFEWKSFDINANKFTIYPNQFYIIRAGEEGVFYKLHFIDFYKDGIKGNPKWEFQRL